MNKKPKLVFTKNIPDKPGYYWWTNFGENTPCIMTVSKDGNGFYAENGEYSFVVKKQDHQLELSLELSKDIREQDGYDKYRYGEELWCYIPNPYLPNGKKQISPMSY